MAQDDVYEVVLHQLMEGEEMVNRFFYRALDNNDSASRLANAFQDTVLEQIKDTVSDAIQFIKINVTNIDNPGQQAEQVDGGLGRRAGAYLPRFVNFVVQMLPNNNLVRVGRKAIAGVLEIDNDGTDLTAGGQGFIDALAVILGNAVVHVTSGAAWEPVLYSPPNLTHPTSTVVSALSTLAKTIVSTQNSRKR